jgi:uncharacterized protein (DUF2267 family)
MPHPRLEAFDHALDPAYTWVADVARELATEDRRFAYRALRSWLHTLRDRLPVSGAAALAAQLPELVRGTFYEGWEPAHVPMKYGPSEYLLRFAQQSRVPVADAQQVAAAVTRAVGHLSPGLLSGTLRQLPRNVRLLLVEAPEPPESYAGPPVVDVADDASTYETRLSSVEDKVANLTEALTVLARGLEEPPGQEPDTGRSARAARLAHEILLATGR